jgi:hypothetical protein
MGTYKPKATSAAIGTDRYGLLFVAAISTASAACLYWPLKANWLWIVVRFPGWLPLPGGLLIVAAEIPVIGYLCGSIAGRPLAGTAIAIFLCVFTIFGLLVP